MDKDNLSPLFKWVNTLPKIFKRIIYAIVWISPFELFVILTYSSTSNLYSIDPNRNASLPKLANYLQGFPLNQLENSSELSRLLLDRTKELEIMAAPFYLLSILALVSLLSWHFKGAPGNKNRLIHILLNPLLIIEFKYAVSIGFKNLQLTTSQDIFFCSKSKATDNAL